MSDEKWDDLYNSSWDEQYDDHHESDYISTFPITYTKFEFGEHPSIIVGDFVFCITSQSKRYGQLGYLELPQGEGGLYKTSYLNLNERYSLSSCTVKYELGCISTEMWDSISHELSKRYPDLDFDGYQSEIDEEEYYW
jgi:hypothetical protein